MFDDTKENYKATKKISQMYSEGVFAKILRLPEM